MRSEAAAPVDNRRVGSVAGALKRELEDEADRLGAAERSALSLRLGDDDAALFASVRAVSLEEARRLLQLQRQQGRRPSASARDVLG